MANEVIAWLSAYDPPHELVEYCLREKNAILVRPLLFEQNGCRIVSARDVLRYARAAVAEYAGEQGSPLAVFVASGDQLPQYVAKTLGDVPIFKAMLVQRATGLHWTGVLLKVRDA
jgi:hypothetical protein